VVQQGRDNKVILVNIGPVEGKIPLQEQVPTESFVHGDRIKALIVDVRQGNKGPEIVLSRTHPNLIKKLFALEVPELVNGVVEIMGIAREAGCADQDGCSRSSRRRQSEGFVYRSDGCSSTSGDE